jgi:hypothetical protein
VSLTLDGNAIASYSFTGLLNDGQIGLITNGGAGSYDEFTIRTDDPLLNNVAPRSSLSAASEPSVVTSSQAAALTDQQLAPIVAEAIRRWTLVDPDAASLLSTVSVHVESMSGSTLGYTQGSTILIDDTAAGFGWYVDSTPSEDSEFARPNIAKSDAGSTMDLLSVVMHEMGHVLGLNHDTQYDDESLTTLMNDVLDVGQRTAPSMLKPHSRKDVQTTFAQSTSLLLNFAEVPTLPLRKQLIP